jgi:hypothetical protein
VSDYDAYSQRGEKAIEICKAQWDGRGKNTKTDPCDSCRLFEPCVRRGCVVPGIQAFNAWIDGINRSAQEALL